MLPAFASQRHIVLEVLPGDVMSAGLQEVQQALNNNKWAVAMRMRPPGDAASAQGR